MKKSRPAGGRSIRKRSPAGFFALKIMKSALNNRPRSDRIETLEENWEDGFPSPPPFPSGGMEGVTQL